MKHIRAVNKKARRIDDMVTSRAADVVALQQQRPHVPMGCTLSFSPGWEVDSAGGTAGLCQPVERDIYDCYVTCFWPAQVPDHLNNYPDWASKCAAATKDWRKLDLVFP
jgi:Quinohemoprotein amine dehydrogenase, gamma subunit